MKKLENIIKKMKNIMSIAKEKNNERKYTSESHKEDALDKIKEAFDNE